MPLCATTAVEIASSSSGVHADAAKALGRAARSESASTNEVFMVMEVMCVVIDCLGNNGQGRKEGRASSGPRD